jgi:uncharacterized membrane protein YedE/YeeE
MNRAQYLTAAASGGLFAAGLAVSGMAQPAKVVGFLDFTGAWDPSLAFVMMGAIAINFVLHKLSSRRAQPFFGEKFFRPAATDFTPQLVIGSALFGAGWGLAGYCPGPAIISTVVSTDALIFVGAMAVGMGAHWFWERTRDATPAPIGVEASLSK